MDRTENIDSILRQFRKKSKRIVNKDFFTEFFYLNKNRKVVEFLVDEKENLILESYLKKFLPSDFSNFVKIKILNDEEEEIKTWFYDKENLVLVIKVNWGFNKQEISIEVDMENFSIMVIDEKGFVLKKADYILLNDFFISFITNQAKGLSESFKRISKK